MKYFVTGATGFVGGAVVRQLVESGHQVVALAREPSQAKKLAELGVDLRLGDVVARESMRAPMTGVDGVFHVAGWYKIGARDNRAAEQVNVQGTRNVLELMRELEIPKGVYTSSLAVFSDTGGRVVKEGYFHGGPWLSEYDRTKWIAHYQVAVPLMRQGLPLVIVQPGLVYGPGGRSPSDNVLLQYLQHKLPVTPERTAWCWGHVEDTARGHILAMEKGKAGESYIIAGPEHTLIDALGIAERITGVPAPRLHPAPWMVKLLSRMMAPIERLLPLSETFTSEGLRVAAGVTYLGLSTKAQQGLGFSARPLEDGLREVLLYEMEQMGLLP